MGSLSELYHNTKSIEDYITAPILIRCLKSSFYNGLESCVTVRELLSHNDSDAIHILPKLSGKPGFDNRTLFQVILKHEAHPGKSQDH